MIAVNPPKVAPYAPSSQPIATVKVNAWVEPNLGLARLNVQLFDEKGAPVAIDRSQIPAMTKDQEAAFLAYKPTPGDSMQASVQKAALPYLQAAYGLAGAVS